MQQRYAVHLPALRRAPPWPYLTAALGTAAMTAPLMLVQRHLNIFNVSLLYLLPVLLSATLGGLGPGIVSAIVALFAFDWYFLSPRYTVTVTNPQDLVAFGVFLGAAAVAGQLGAVARRRARNATVLHELSATLSASADPVETLPVVAARIAAAFGLSRCSLTLYDSGSDQREEQTASTVHLASPSVFVAPLRRGAVETGVLRLAVQSRRHLGTDERQVLETLVQASAVAIERARLAAEERVAAVARESDRLKSALLAAVSHELRTPLASIKATTSGLLQEDVVYDAATLRRFLGGIDGEADRLMRLVSNLLDVSRIEAGALHPEMDWYEPGELIGTALGTLAPLLATHHVAHALDADLPLVRCDYVQALHVLTNLLENVVRYAPGGTTLTISATNHDYDNEVWLTVADEGPGVAIHEREAIFSPFVRGTAAGGRGGGIGLGLAICKGLVEANEGRIWVDDAPRGGAAFTFALPCLVGVPYTACPGERPAAETTVYDGAQR